LIVDVSFVRISRMIYILNREKKSSKVVNLISKM
jgi:hypothetical protein